MGQVADLSPLPPSADSCLHIERPRKIPPPMNKCVFVINFAVIQSMALCRHGQCSEHYAWLLTAYQSDLCIVRVPLLALRCVTADFRFPPILFPLTS